MIIALESSIRDLSFYNLLTAPLTVCNKHVGSSGQGAIVCKSRAIHPALFTCNISCRVVRRDSSAIKSDKSLNRIHFDFVLLAEPLTDEGGEEIGVPGENPRRRASENATYWKFKVQPRLEPALYHWWWQAAVLTHTTRRPFTPQVTITDRFQTSYLILPRNSVNCRSVSGQLMSNSALRVVSVTKTKMSLYEIIKYILSYLILHHRQDAQSPRSGKVKPTLLAPIA